jgi:serine/threonine protein kinase
MTPEQWQKVEAVLQAALDRPAPERASFLDQACAGDAELFEEATSLVSAYDQAGDFIEQPAIAQDARVLVGAELADNLGREIGPYKIIERLGVGGMGEVYLAEDTRLDRLVALKILPTYFASDEERLRRFQREARAASALNHPNILTIHEVGETDGIYFIATEFIDGATIRQLLAKRELSLAAIFDIAEQVASALAAAHAAGIVHRDIKPENIMRRTDGLVKILDFGIAKLMEPDAPDDDDTQPVGSVHTEAGLLLGTVNYMSPEQARGLAVDERTDVWSLGVVLYEMLTGRLPFSGATSMDTVVAILDREPAPLGAHANYDISPLLVETIHSCLRKEKDERLSSASELLAALKQAKEGLEVSQLSAIAATKVSTAQSSRASSGVRTWQLVALVLVLLTMVAGVILYRRSASLPPSSALTTPATKLYSQMSEAEQINFVDQQAQRISTMMGDRPVKLDPEAVAVIKSYVDHSLRPRQPGEDTLDDIYQRGAPYVPLIARSFAARKVPVVIGIYLPVIESAYRECFQNSIGARGLFQFLPQTAKTYGISYEEMCNAEKVAPAAANYIADRMAELGEDSESMTLVLLSYNRGAESVRNNLRRLRGTDNYARNFWTLFAHRNELDEQFRNEGAHYVPSFFAAAIIGENPHAFGLTTPPLSKLAAQ